jgi:hypothetical protein
LSVQVPHSCVPFAPKRYECAQFRHHLLVMRRGRGWKPFPGPEDVEANLAGIDTLFTISGQHGEAAVGTLIAPRREIQRPLPAVAAVCSGVITSSGRVPQLAASPCAMVWLSRCRMVIFWPGETGRVHWRTSSVRFPAFLLFASKIRYAVNCFDTRPCGKWFRAGWGRRIQVRIVPSRKTAVIADNADGVPGLLSAVLLNRFVSASASALPAARVPTWQKPLATN